MSSMSEGFPSQKTQAVVQFLVPICLGYLATVVFLSRGAVPTTGQLWDHATVAAVIAVAATLFQDLIPKPVKEWLVFYRLRDRLPGHRCFTDAALNNPRIEKTRLADLDHLTSLTADGQNKAWYRFYKTVSAQPAIRHYSFRYLAWRDSATVLLGLSLATVGVWFLFPGTMPPSSAKILGVGCFLLHLAASAAARGASRELMLLVLIEMETK
jgi:hypothetical protein